MFSFMRLLLVDGHYYLYRSFYAIRGLRNSRGEPTNAIYGYAKALRKMFADLKPDLAAIVWDSGLPARRTILQPEYKQNRTAMPDDLRPQEEWLQENIFLFAPARALRSPATPMSTTTTCAPASRARSTMNAWRN